MSKKPDAPKIEFPPTIIRRLAELTPDPNNAREHPAEQIEVLRASIREYGPTLPILLKPGDIIGAGNGRWAAAQLEGYVEWPTVTLNLTAEQWTAYAIMDNKSALGAKWNEDRLRQQLTALAKLENVTSLTGFKAAELGKLKVPGFASRQQQVTLGDAEFGVIITVETEEQQAELLERFIGEKLKVKALL